MLTDDQIMAQVLAAFQEEQAEHRQAAGELLLEIERRPDHPQRQELLDQLFREAHSLKGGARAAGQPAVEQIAHRIEDLFSAVRKGELQLTPEVCDPVYTALDAIGLLMGEVAAGRTPDPTAHAALIEQLAQVSHHPAPAPPLNQQAAPPPNDTSAATGLPQRNGTAQKTAAAEPAASSDEPPVAQGTTIRIPTASLDALMNETGELVTCSLRSRQHARDMGRLVEQVARWRRVWQQTRRAYERLQTRTPPIRPAVHYLDDRDQLPATNTDGSGGHEIDLLLGAIKTANDLITDLQEQLQQQGRQVAENSGQLDAVIDRIQSRVRRARMLPIHTIFGQLRLQAREMARTAGKQVILLFDDGAAEADREILEQLRDVLLHLLRNAIDHGIELPATRVAQGKAGEGQIVLRADIDGDRLQLTMADDGAGLDVQAIRQRALAAHLVAPNDLDHMGDDEVARLIFLPGLSTRASVSALSGRGVGLDIVRAQVERLRGRVDVQSEPGRGCTFALSVPLLLASAHGLLFTAGEASYALPLDAVQHIVAVSPRDIQLLEGRAVLVVGGRPRPLARMNDLFGGDTPALSPGSRTQLALLLGEGERQVACLIDSVLGEQELITHRLPPPLRQVRFVSGATILSDGSVVPILDVGDLVGAALGQRSVVRAVAPPQEAQTRRVLVVDDSITTRTLEKNILEAAGYVVLLATDGVEALQLLDQSADDGGCDLLLSDVDMPRLNGFDLTAQVRAHPRHKSLPIVLVTSLDTPADRERGIAAGADAYLVKRTFDQQTLLDTIAHYV